MPQDHSAPPMDYRQAFESSATPCVILAPDLTIVAANDSYLQATMTERNSIVGRHIFEVFPENPADTEAKATENSKASFDRVLASGEPDAMAIQKHDVRRPVSEGGGFEERFWSPINSPLLGPDGKVAFIMHRVVNVTALVNAGRRHSQSSVLSNPIESHLPEMASILIARAQEIERTNNVLRKRELLFRSTLDSVLEGAMILGFDWTYLYLNENAAHHGRRKREELLGRTLLEMYPGVEKSEVFAHYRRSLEERIALRFEESFTFAEGGKEWFEFSVEPVPEGIFVLSRNITERKNATELIARLREDRIIALEVKSESQGAREQMAIEVMANLSHDVRTPLAAIKGYAETLLRGGLEDEKNRVDFVQTIMKNADWLSFLVEDMLFLTDLDSRAKNPAFEFQTVDLASIVEKYVKTLPPDADAKKISRTIDVAPGLMVRADADHLTRIIQNLLDNAVKYNRRGGLISIEARADGAAAVVTVRDTGRGIPKADLSLIFGRLYRGRATKHLKGTGLGLAIVKTIVELHGGRIWVESVFRKGSAFHFTLPLAS